MNGISPSLPVPDMTELLETPSVNDSTPDNVSTATATTAAKGKRRTSKSKQVVQGSPEQPKKRLKVGPRASIACALCRKRKIRCSGDYPTCTFCQSKDRECVYEVPPTPVHPQILLQTQQNGHNASPSTSSLPLPPALPPLEVQHAVLDQFFHNFVDAGMFTFLHRINLTSEVSNGTVPLEILYSMLALSARFTPSLADLHENHTKAGHTYADAAREIVRSTPDTLSLTRLQCLLMLSLHDCTEGRAGSGWILLGTAVRLCNLLRLARYEKPDDGIEGPSNLPGAATDARDSEERRRTYWAAFLLDRLLCDGYERQPMMRHDPYFATIRLPRSDEDYHCGNWGLSARFEREVPEWARPAAAVDRSPLEPEADLFGQAMRVADLWSRVLSYVGQGGHNIDRRAPWQYDSTFAILDRALNDWLDHLPEPCRYNESNRVAYAMVGKSQLFGLVHLTYFAAVLYLHRDYIPFVPVGGVFDSSSGMTDGEPLISDTEVPPGWWTISTAKAFTAADAVTDLVRSLKGSTTGGGLLGHPFCGFAVLTAGTMHAHLHCFSTAPLPRYYEYVVADAQILDVFRQHWTVANQWCKGLNMLFDTYSNHRDATAYATPHTAALPPWSRTREDIMRIVPADSDAEHDRNADAATDLKEQRSAADTLSRLNGVASPGVPYGLPTPARPPRKRYDLFALLAEAGELGPDVVGDAPASPIFPPDFNVNDGGLTTDYWSMLGGDMPLGAPSQDIFPLSSFNDWTFGGVGGGGGSWWLN